MDRLISVEEAAKILGVSPNTLRGWVTRRKVRYVKLGSRCLFRPADLEELVESSLREPRRSPVGVNHERSTHEIPA
jgi:excisionase family DNA binding protein